MHIGQSVICISSFFFAGSAFQEQTPVRACRPYFNFYKREDGRLQSSSRSDQQSDDHAGSTVTSQEPDNRASATGSIWNQTERRDESDRQQITGGRTMDRP